MPKAPRWLRGVPCSLLSFLRSFELISPFLQPLLFFVQPLRFFKFACA